MKLDKIDAAIDWSTDHPHNTINDVYKWFNDEISQLLDPVEKDLCDRSEVNDAEVLISMLYRLSSYYFNGVTTKENVRGWNAVAVCILNEEFEEEIEAGDKEVISWISNLNANFKRLENVLQYDR